MHADRKMGVFNCQNKDVNNGVLGHRILIRLTIDSPRYKCVKKTFVCLCVFV